ncbi:MAG: hypothetical protein ACQKBT_03695, partial [Puniceicoccales bacterium]
MPHAILDNPQLKTASGEEPSGPPNPPVAYADIDGERFAYIEDAQTLPVFFLTLVSPGDHWLFTATNGSLTAGRKSPDTALFPYYTVDKIIDNWNSTGPQTWIQTREGELWEPFKPYMRRNFSLRQRLYKSINGDVVIFEEINLDLGLSFRFRWETSERFGFIRTATVTNSGSSPQTLRVVDGITNFMAAGIDSRTQQEYSCLTDAYKISERDESRQMMVHRMAATLTDEAVPMESLRATTVWSYGWPESRILMRPEAAEDFLINGLFHSSDSQRAFRGSYLNAGTLSLEPGASRTWSQVADIEQTQPQVAALRKSLDHPESLWHEV